LFVALRGQTVDGHAFLGKVAAQGAAAVVVEDPSATFTGARILVRSTAHALALIAANRFARPAESLTLVGLTGTNGKTTGAYLTEAILIAAGSSPGVIGTVEYRSPRGARPAPFTTPTPLELHRTLAEMRDAGCTHVVMECSSHALALGRLNGLSFAVASFSNLTQDHLDFHGDMAAYADAKKLLFSSLLDPSGVAVVCVDGAYGEDMAAVARARVLRVSSTGAPADVRMQSATPTASGTRVELQTPRGQLAFESPLVGAFNVENLAVAVGLGIGLGLELEQIGEGLRRARGAPGRLERVTGPVAAYVDYAHTPDALERALAALRPTTEGRLWVVFGCGGDRDRGKRPLMGRIGSVGADLAIVTSDNPRSEAPRAILDEIAGGIDPALVVDARALAARDRGVALVEDRREAICLAVDCARPGDVILVAGKGHEDYQIVGQTRLRFDDREVLRDALQRRSKDGG
jgi:UDP-N-acetylmuramyl-tripeptide synthetase